MTRARRYVVVGAVAFFVVGLVVPFATTLSSAQVGLGEVGPACDFSATGQGWGLLSADQDRPFFEAPLPVDAAVPHARTEITNSSAIGQGYLADPGIVGRGQVEAARPIPSGDPIYTVPQPLFPASATAAQPGGAPASSFGAGGGLDPTRQFAFGAGRVDAGATEAPSQANVTARFEEASFSPGPNQGEVGSPPDAERGAVQRGAVTVGAVATRAESVFDDRAGVVRGLAATTLSDVNIADVVFLRSFEVLAETVTGGEKPVRRGVAKADGFAVGGQELPFDEAGLEQANQALAPFGFELFAARKAESAEGDEEAVVVEGLALRGENVDSSGERRRVNLVLGHAQATSKCLAVDLGVGTEIDELPPLDTGDDFAASDTGGTAFVDPLPSGTDATLGAEPEALPSPGPSAGVGGDGAGPLTQVPVSGRGPMGLTWRWDWGKFGVKFWSAGDIFIAAGSFGPFVAAGLLAWQRRRLSRLL